MRNFAHSTQNDAASTSRLEHEPRFTFHDDTSSSVEVIDGRSIGGEMDGEIAENRRQKQVNDVTYEAVAHTATFATSKRKEKVRLEDGFVADEPAKTKKAK